MARTLHISAPALAGALALATPALAQDEPQCETPSVWYAAQWAYLLLDPSTANPACMQGLPAAQQLVPDAQREPASERRIVLFGDVLPIQQDAPPWVHPELRDLFASADLIIGNIETPVFEGPVDADSSPFDALTVPSDFVQSLFTQYCIDPDRTALTIANNHSGDAGRAGWDETRSLLGGLAAGVVGQRQPDGSLLRTFDVNGVRVGVVGWTHLENCPLDDGPVRPTDVQNVDWVAEKQARGIDVLIGSPHWEREFHHFPEQATRAAASDFVAAGFDVIAGHHPHVLQPAERIGDALAFYSLGNLNVYMPAFYTQLFGVFELIVDGQGRLVRYEVHPFVQRSDDAQLPAEVHCADGRVGYDTARHTEWELVPLSAIDNFWGTRDRLRERFELLFPPGP